MPVQGIWSHRTLGYIVVGCFGEVGRIIGRRTEIIVLRRLRKKMPGYSRTLLMRS